jgi:hypothetical protein
MHWPTIAIPRLACQRYFHDVHIELAIIVMLKANTNRIHIYARKETHRRKGRPAEEG